jgi:hypothetical protein
VNHVLVYNTKALLSISSAEKVIPSLIEVPWPEGRKGHARTILNNEAGDFCDEMAQSIMTNIDQHGQLWILDSGTRECGPKLLVYNTRFRFYRLASQSLSLYKNWTFASVVVDTALAEDGNTKAFLSVKSSNFLLVYSLLTKRLAKLEFS